MFRMVLTILLLLALPNPIRAGETISVPWEEVKRLYQESIEKKLLERFPPDKARQLYTIEQALYRLNIGNKRVTGAVTISGKVLSGKPEPIPLFGNDIVIDRVKQTTGGSLMGHHTGEKRIAFLPSGAKAFRIDITFLVPVQEDSRSRFVTFRPPAALESALRLTLSPDITRVEAPGIAGSKGVYHVSAGEPVTVRFAEKRDIRHAPAIDVDLVSRILIQGRRTLVETTCLPGSLPASFVMKAPEGFGFISTSLKRTAVKNQKNRRYHITLGPKETVPFTVQFAREESGVTDTVQLSLPAVLKNNGTEGLFFIQEPVDRRISLSPDTPAARVRPSKLPSGLRAVFGNESGLMALAAETPIGLQITRFQPIPTPPIVLDEISFFTAFEETGHTLSILSMTVPPEAGPRMTLAAVPDAQIWSLKVNGKKGTVYGGREDQWIVPLIKGETSHVELAFIRHGEKMGLRGRLETVLPRTDLPARRARVGIALPPRVELLALEGPVSPEGQAPKEVPAGFIGKPHYFSRAFYKGGGMEMAVFYKEPVK